MPTPSKVLSRYWWLVWRASGAVRSTNPNPDHDKFMARGARYELAGQKMEALVFYGEANNDRRNHKAVCVTSLGPHTAAKPAYCLRCCRPMDRNNLSRECTGAPTVGILTELGAVCLGRPLLMGKTVKFYNDTDERVVMNVILDHSTPDRTNHEYLATAVPYTVPIDFFIPAVA